MTPEFATIQALRSDLALQIARYAARTGRSQLELARQLGIPQPTLSKIVNAQVSDLSLELLIRIAVRARLSLALQTGKDSADAGVYVTGGTSAQRRQRSQLADDARQALARDIQRLTPPERLAAQLRHCELLAALQSSPQSKSRRKPTAPRRRAP
jgi:predicted XRE-type DNA-binding protein